MSTRRWTQCAKPSPSSSTCTPGRARYNRKPSDAVRSCMIPRVLLLSLCLFGSGAAGLMYEVLWSRQFSLVMGQTVYALSAIITAFLGGLALGAWVGGRWTRRRG